MASYDFVMNICKRWCVSISDTHYLSTDSAYWGAHRLLLEFVDSDENADRLLETIGWCVAYNYGEEQKYFEYIRNH
jgi:hypothetical protein